MSLIVLGSVKASPGVTTTALALAAMWPHDRTALVAEFDRAGGDIAARFGLPSEPGLVSLAAATRHMTDDDGLLWQHTQELPGGLHILIAPASGARVRTARAMLKPSVFAGQSDVDILIDLGRIELSDAAESSVVGAADVVVIVVRPVIAELHHLAEMLPAIGDCNTMVTVLISGRGQYGRDDVEQALGADVIGTLPHDPHGAEALEGIPTSTRGFSRLPLLRGARTIAEDIVVRLPRADVPPTAEGSRDVPLAESVA